jgi:hypothetical protein
VTDEPVISTKDQVGDYDAIETLKPGEPVFPLQGGDPFAPACIELWVEQCRAAARDVEEEDVEKRKALLTKALNAEHVLWACIAYQRGEEIAAVDRTTVNVVQNEDRLWRAPIISAVRQLREAAYQFMEATAHLPDAQAEALRFRIATINGIAEDYQPKRASYGREPEFPFA